MTLAIQSTLTTNMTVFNDDSIIRKSTQCSHALPIHCWEWFVTNNVFIGDVHVHKLKQSQTKKNDLNSITNTV